MRVVTVAILFFGSFLSLEGQSYYYLKQQGGNPKNVATSQVLNVQSDDESTGWSLIDTTEVNPKYTKSQKIPFTFNFAGQPVTHFKISTTGFITFDTTVLGSPSSVTQNLPTTNLPSKSVCVWGLSGHGRNDQIVTKVFGAAPNRQFWIKFSSYSKPGDSSGSWNYWSIVLEESSNRIFAVGMYFNNSTKEYISPKLIIGLQETSAKGLMVNPLSTQNFQASENSFAGNFYYEFIYGNQLQFDLSVYKPSGKTMVKTGDSEDVNFYVSNDGSDTVKIFDLYYSVNNGSPVFKKMNGYKLAGNRTDGALIQLSPRPLAGAAGTVNKIKFWIAKPNGTAEINTANDTGKYEILSVNGTTAPKKVLLEVGTATWCGDAPMADFRLNEIKAKYKDTVIIAEYHSLDGMSGNGDSVNRNYFKTLPMGIADRIGGTDSKSTISTRDSWSGIVKKTKAVYTPAAVKILNIQLDTLSKKFTFKVRVVFRDYCNGNIKIGGMAVENSIRGIGVGFSQNVSTALLNDINNPFYNYWNDHGKILGYYFNNVVWNLPGGIEGKKPVISKAIYSPGDSIEATFSYTYPGLLKTTFIGSSAYLPIGTIYTMGKPADMKAIGFVSTVNADGTTQEILNSNEGYLWNLALNRMDVNPGKLSVYPNPSKGQLFFQVANGNYSANIMNVQGTVVFDSELDVKGGTATLDFSNKQLKQGIYFLQLRSKDNKVFSSSFVVE